MTNSLRTLTLKCTSCGSDLEISSDIDRFACGYCGTQQIVERKGGTVAIKPLTDAISKVQVGTDKAAAELALRRLQEEAEVLRIRRIQRMEIAEREHLGVFYTAVLAAGVSALIAWIIGTQVGFLGVLVLLFGCGGAAFTWYRREAEISLLERKDVKALDTEIGLITEKIFRNKEIADS